MESEHEELRLLKEALWYNGWSLVFAVAALVVELIAFVEMLQNDFKAVFLLMALACTVYLFARYLSAKSKQLRYRADEVGDD